MNTQPIRILHVIGIMNRGGAETMIMNLYRHIDRDKVQFDFVENDDGPAAFDQEIVSLGGKIYHCPRYNGKNHLHYKKWWNEFWKEHYREYSAVHGHIGSTAAIYLGVAKRYGVYTIAHSHGRYGKSSLRQIAYRTLAYRTRYIADFFFSCSNEAGTDRFGKKAAADHTRYRLLNNAIDTRQFRYDSAIRSEKRKELGFPAESCVIGHVGRFDKAKNQSYLLDIFREVVELDKNARLLLVGEGPLWKEVQEKAAQMQLSDRITFTGIRSDVPELMQAMDLLVFPSKNEGLPVTLVEAQTAGLPCVISDTIPADSIITNDLVTVESLEASPKEWALHVLRRKDELRRDHSGEVTAAGFDIRENAKWLEEFYLEKSKQ